MKINLKKLIATTLLALIPLEMVGLNGIAIISFAALVMVFSGFVKIRKDAPARQLIYLLIAVFFINVVYCYFMYGQPILTGISGVYFIFSALLYFFFYSYFSKDNNRIRVIINHIYAIITVVVILELAQAALFPHFNVFDYKIHPSGGIRIYGTTLTFYALLFTIADTVIYKKKKLYITFILIALMLILVSRSRAGIIFMFIVVVFSIFQKILSRKNKARILQAALFLVVLIILLIFTYVNGYLDGVLSFTEEIKYEFGSGYTRFRETEYYFTLFEKNPLFGIGYLRGGSELADEVYNISQHFYIQDLGLLSSIYQTGIIGAIWYIYLLIEIIKRMRQLKKTNDKLGRWLRIVLSEILLLSVIGFSNVNYLTGISSLVCFVLFFSMVDAYIMNSIHEVREHG